MSGQVAKVLNDGKSPLWHIEARMIATRDYFFPQRATLNRMYALISMDRDICLHTQEPAIVARWNEAGVPADTIQNGDWMSLQKMAESDKVYADVMALYGQLLAERK